RHISKTMSLELGFRYTPYRIYKVKELTASGKKISGKEPVIEPSASRFSARLLEEGNIAPVAMEDKPIEFKGNIRRLFYRLSMIDLIDPERALKINISGNIIQVSSRTIKNCFAYMVYSALHNGSDIPGSCRFEMEAILISELESIRLGNKLTPSALRQLEGIRRSLHALPKSEDSSALNGGYNMDDIYRAVSHFSPNTTRDQVVKFMEGVVE
ncbi:MAG: hypothetical protein ABI543_15565, partial [Ignavibacteria bacterium]